MDTIRAAWIQDRAAWIRGYIELIVVKLDIV